jgi:YVTN family beta-propeller protein
MRVGPAPGGRTIVATGQILRPAGESLTFGGRPVDLALSSDRRTLYVKDDRGVVVVDAAAWKIRQELALPNGGGSMHGVAVTGDGGRVFVTDAQNLLCEATVVPDGRLAWSRRIALHGPEGKGASYPCGIALAADGKTAFVALSRNNSLGIVDLAAGRLRQEIPVGIAPFGVALSPDGRRAYVSNWGGRRAKSGERTAPSSGTDALVDARGVAVSGTVSVVDRVEGREAAQIETGLHPCGLALDPSGRRLYVANANSDTVSAIDTAVNRVVETVNVRPDPALPFGSMPNALALSADGRMLYVANGGNNAVAVVALEARGQAKSVVRGFIPAGWFPGGLAVDGGRLFVANVKGLGSRNPSAGQKGWRVAQFLGTMSRVTLPQAAELAQYTRQVRADARVPEILRAWERKQSGRKPVPVPARTGEPSVFEHVVYVIKENRTYDQLFGDLPEGTNDPALCLFGREVTPNHHALAEQFVLLDNYYCNGVNSADGHAWATEGNVTGYLEKAFGGFTRSYTFGDDPLSYSASGFLWDQALLAGLSFRNYGEMDYAEPVPADASFPAIYRDFTERAGRIRFTQNIGIEPLRRYSSRSFPGWNLRIPDVLRADAFLTELRQADKQSSWPSLQIVYLPSDHTSGTQPGMPTPRAQVADNDLALGRVIEGITKSRFWPKTCIFVIEDDPQDGFDHVDGHRSICLVVSPYTRRGTVVSEFYNQTSVLHTMERILGLPPMNQMVAMAPLMTACFAGKPDPRPFTALPNRVALDEMNPPMSALRGQALHWAQESARLPLEKSDQADEDLLNRILWHAVRGVDTPYPADLAGAHGRGLKALHLKHAKEQDDDTGTPF